MTANAAADNNDGGRYGSHTPAESLAATKHEITRAFWEDPDLHMSLDTVEDMAAKMRKQLVRALSNGIVCNGGEGPQ